MGFKIIPEKLPPLTFVRRPQYTAYESFIFSIYRRYVSCGEKKTAFLQDVIDPQDERKNNRNYYFEFFIGIIRSKFFARVILS